MSDLVLETRGLQKDFRGFVAVGGVDLKVRRGTIHALIGPNGAGKTTCFNLLTKFLSPTSASRPPARSSSASSERSERQKWKEVPSLRCSATRTFSSTVKCGNTAEIWNERTMPRRAICAGGSRVMSRPLKRMLPRVGSRNLVSRLKQVVLPAPLGPMSAWMSPRATFRLTLLTATKPLNSLTRPSVSRMKSRAFMEAARPATAARAAQPG